VLLENYNIKFKNASYNKGNNNIWRLSA